jgi:glyoxylase-like metal-dependent hydrolase (beta-lactamase superfamily II)
MPDSPIATPASESRTAMRPLLYPLGEHLPQSGTVTEVAPGVFWLRMGLPFALNHINLWLLRDRLPHPTQSGVMQEGWTAVDCGIDNPATREAWQHIETQALQGLPILRVLVTHMHPDHMGLAHWLCERWQAPLWMSTSEYQSALLACSGLSNFGGDPTVQFFAAHGWHKAEDLAVVRSRVGYYPSMVPKIPNAYVRLMAGAQVRIGDRLWQCISGYGHSPEHMALHDVQGQLLISGDMLLPSMRWSPMATLCSIFWTPWTRCSTCKTRLWSCPRTDALFKGPPPALPSCAATMRSAWTNWCSLAARKHCARTTHCP